MRVTSALARAHARVAQARADVPIGASCYCRLTASPA